MLEMSLELLLAHTEVPSLEVLIVSLSVRSLQVAECGLFIAVSHMNSRRIVSSYLRGVYREQQDGREHLGLAALFLCAHHLLVHCFCCLVLVTR